MEVQTETEFPKQESFYSALNDCHVSTENNQHACRVWDNLQINTIRDYLDIHLKTDVFVLADVIEAYKKLDRRNYEIDPGYYYCTAGIYNPCLFFLFLFRFTQKCFQFFFKFFFFPFFLELS